MDTDAVLKQAMQVLDDENLDSILKAQAELLDIQGKLLEAMYKDHLLLQERVSKLENQGKL